MAVQVSASALGQCGPSRRVAGGELPAQVEVKWGAAPSRSERWQTAQTLLAALYQTRQTATGRLASRSGAYGRGARAGDRPEPNEPGHGSKKENFSVQKADAGCECG